MLGLIRGLAECDERFFTGWVLARAEIAVDGAADDYINTVVAEKPRKVVMEVQGRRGGVVCQRLRSLLVLPRQSLAARAVKSSIPSIGKGDLKAYMRHTFTQAEIDDYTALSGDDNIIHKASAGRAIVPGLCMAYFLQQKLKLKELHWTVSFLSPVFADDDVYFYKKDSCIEAYADGILVFKIEVQ